MAAKIGSILGCSTAESPKPFGQPFPLPFHPGVCNYWPPFWPPCFSHLLWPCDDVWTLKDCDMPTVEADVDEVIPLLFCAKAILTSVIRLTYCFTVFNTASHPGLRVGERWIRFVCLEMQWDLYVRFIMFPISNVYACRKGCDQSLAECFRLWGSTCDQHRLRNGSSSESDCLGGGSRGTALWRNPRQVQRCANMFLKFQLGLSGFILCYLHVNLPGFCLCLWGLLHKRDRQAKRTETALGKSVARGSGQRWDTSSLRPWMSHSPWYHGRLRNVNVKWRIIWLVGLK